MPSIFSNVISANVTFVTVFYSSSVSYFHEATIKLDILRFELEMRIFGTDKS